MEMTYYDTREQDEAVIERRKEAAERMQGKTNTQSNNSGLSGPRQFEKFKRRPLPTDPSGVAPPRPPAPEHVQSAPPLHHPQPSRPAIRDHAQMMPPSTGPDTLHHPPRHTEPSYDASSYPGPVPSMHPRGAYDGPDDYQRQWSAPAPAPAPAPALPPAGMMRRNTHEPPYPTNDTLDRTYDSRQPQPHSQTDYDYQPSRDYRATSEPPIEHGMDRRAQYDAAPQPHDAYSIVSPQYNVNPMTFGQVSTFSPRSSYVHEPAPSSYGRPGSSSGPVEDPRYQSHMKALPPPTRDVSYHPEYAMMQPRVEDEEEDRPPPPPPVHRSRMAQQPSPTNQSASSYAPYTPTHSSNPSMPASLVAGYEPGDRLDQSAYEDRSLQRRSTHFDDEMMLAHAAASAPASAPAPAPAPLPYEPPVYPLRTSPRPMEEPSGPVSSQVVSANPDTRAVVRKSVSPRPPSSDGRTGSSNPFSPDSYDALNPHASRPPDNRDLSPAYETPSQANQALVRSESERDPDQPIIGDDGREIDPSDHLPTDTWAPEPERKNRKPEVIIRFKHSPRPTSRGNDTAPARSTPPRVGFRTTPDTYSPIKRYPPQMHSDSVDRTPPRADRGQEAYGSYTHGRGYSTPTSADRPRSSHQGSVSPTPGSRSPLCDYGPGPLIPSKVPVSGAPAYPVSPSHPSNGRPGMDALSRELSTIDIGSVGCSPSRTARRYAPRTPASMGYAT